VGRSYGGHIIGADRQKGPFPDLEVRVFPVPPSADRSGPPPTDTSTVGDPCPRGAGRCGGRALPTAWRLRNMPASGVAVLYENGIAVDQVDLTAEPIGDLHVIFPPQ
jgi:hypothetical protein